MVPETVVHVDERTSLIEIIEMVRRDGRPRRLEFGGRSDVVVHKAPRADLPIRDRPTEEQRRAAAATAGAWREVDVDDLLQTLDELRHGAPEEPSSQRD
jgi:hypothetical protein